MGWSPRAKTKRGPGSNEAGSQDRTGALCPAEPSDGEAVDLAARELRDSDSRTARDRDEITFRALFTSDTLREGPCSIRIQELFNSQA